MARSKMSKNKTPKEVFQGDNSKQDKEELKGTPAKGKKLPGFKLKQYLNKGEWKSPERI